MGASLAIWLLRDRPEWTHGRIVQESQRGIPTTLEVKKPLAVHILYWTAFVDDAGELHFSRDLYHRDPRLDGAMRWPPSPF